MGRTRSCLAVAILLPSGVHADYRINVIQGSSILQLKVVWPNVLSNVRELHRLWLVMENGRRVSRDHSKLVGLRMRYADYALQQMRK